MSTVPIFDIERRDGPLLISIPHVGTDIPKDLRSAYTREALALPDTDWHLDRLYGFASALDATVIRARVSRYVIDLNRPVNGSSLYPGMITTSLCPTETFSGDMIYPGSEVPDSGEVARRAECYWRPYHEALSAEIDRLRAVHQNVLLWDAHSIASVLPRLFSGTLPDFNFGTSDGQSCDDTIASAAIQPFRRTSYTWVLNGRFKGGFITRKYGAPRLGVHAIQLEMCQSLYMEERVPFKWREDLASSVAPFVRSSVEGALSAVTQLSKAEPFVDVIRS